MRFANLAVRGKKLDAIAGGQLDAALELGPQLISIAGGGNDILRPAVDLDHVLGTMERAVIRARAAGVDVLLCTGFYVNKGAALKSTQGRTGILNASLWSMARRHGAYLVDTWELRPVRDVRLWADDRIHLRPDGHRRVADAALVALGLEPDDPDYATPLKPGPVVPQRVRAAEEARWLKEYAGPWVKRRLTGTSSGDGRLGKDQELREI